VLRTCAVIGAVGGRSVSLVAIDSLHPAHLLLRSLLLHQAGCQATTTTGPVPPLVHRCLHRSLLVSCTTGSQAGEVGLLFWVARVSTL